MLGAYEPGNQPIDVYESLDQTQWKWLHHVGFIPKCRRRALHVELGKYQVDLVRRLAEHKESRGKRGHWMSDHVHMALRLPRNYAVAQVVGCIKGNGAIPLQRLR